MSQASLEFVDLAGEGQKRVSQFVGLVFATAFGFASDHLVEALLQRLRCVTDKVSLARRRARAEAVERRGDSYDDRPLEVEDCED